MTAVAGRGAEFSPWKTMRHAWAERVGDSAMSSGAKELAWALWRCVDKDSGETYRKYGTLARMAGKTERTIRRRAAEMVAWGFMAVERYGHGRRHHVLRLVPQPAEPRSGVVVNVDFGGAEGRPVARPRKAPRTGSEGGDFPRSLRTNGTGPGRSLRTQKSVFAGENVREHYKESPCSLSLPPGRGREPVDNFGPERRVPTGEERALLIVALLAEGLWRGTVGQLVTAERIAALVEAGRLTAERGAELLAEHGPKAPPGTGDEEPPPVEAPDPGGDAVTGERAGPVGAPGSGSWPEPPAGAGDEPGAVASEPPPVSAENRRRDACLRLADGAWLGASFGIVTAERVAALVEAGRLTAERGAELLAEHGPKPPRGGEPEPCAVPRAAVKGWRPFTVGMKPGAERAAIERRRGGGGGVGGDGRDPTPRPGGVP